MRSQLSPRTGRVSWQLALGLIATLLVILATMLYRETRPVAEPTEGLASRSTEATNPESLAVSALPSQDGQGTQREGLVTDPEETGAAETATLKIRIAHADGADTAGFELRVLHREGSENATLELTTDERGLAEVELPGGTNLRSVAVLSTATTTPEKKWLNESTKAGELIEVELTVTGGHSLSGQVVDTEGQPVPNAEVQGWCSRYKSGDPDRSTRADAAGRFQLNHIGPQFVATAHSGELVCLTGLRGKLSSHVEAVGLTITLTQAKTMHGVVRDPEHNAVAGAEVWVSNGLSSSSDRDLTQVAGISTFRAGDGRSETDAVGRFEIGGLPHKSHLLHVKQAPYLVYAEWNPIDEGPIEVTLESGISLRGQVLDARGKPAVGAKVRFWPFYGNVQTTAYAVRCDERGEFHLRGMIGQLHGREMQHTIAVLHDGHAVQVVPSVEPSAEGGEFVEVRLVPERVIAGVVTDPQGAPVEGVEIWIEGDREMNIGVSYARRTTWELCNDIHEVETDAEGRFRFEKLYDGAFTVHAISPDDRNQTVDFDTRSGNEQVSLVLDPQAMRKVVLVGTVRDSLTGEPVTKFDIMPMIESWAQGYSFEDEEGHFELPGLSPGPIEIRLRAEGYADRRVAQRHYDLGEHRLDFDLARVRSLEVSVVDEERKPYDAGIVYVLDQAGNAVSFGANGSRSSASRLQSGKARLHGLPAEQLTLRIGVGRRDDEGLHDFPIDLGQARDTPLELVIERAERKDIPVAAVSFLLLVLDPEQSEEELRAKIDAQEEGWFSEALESGAVTYPKHNLQLDAYRGDRPLARSLITPTEAGKFRVETSSSTSLWGGGSTSSSSTSERDWPLVRFRAPAGEITVKLTSEHYANLELALTCSAEDSGKQPQVLLLKSE